ncbi:MAG: tRNA (adenosine(37)-N6)-dimethylallyltransferase MiaA [Muribaculaceae bacterium]|nr:tRNA (adenosine(37)-N6)-dimethylallyltransferase MiaA [Muribaculaceae bacterium]
MTDKPAGTARKPLLIVITGPTGSGKSDLAIEVARHYGTEIISADSRQMYRGIPIGTAQPTAEQLDAVRHHFIASLELTDYYSAARFEEEVMALLPRVMDSHGGVAVMCGGSMMYVDAVTRGIDDLPTITEDVRREVGLIAEKEGAEGLRARLRMLDPAYYETVDLKNTKRLAHALEIIIESGQTYTELRQGKRKARPFETVTFVINYDREELFDRINRRVDAMVAQGLVGEAESVKALRHVNALNTVGYKEIYSAMDGDMDFATAIERIKKNTRVYAKKQLTWLKRDREGAADVNYLDPHKPMLEQVIEVVESGEGRAEC